MVRHLPFGVEQSFYRTVRGFPPELPALRAACLAHKETIGVRASLPLAPPAASTGVPCQEPDRAGNTAPPASRCTTRSSAARQPALLTAETIAEFSTPHLTGRDLVTGDHDAFGLGFERPATEFPALGPDAFGHCGVAGSLGLADPRSGLAYGYVRRRLAFPGGTAPENARLIQALVNAAAEAA